MRCTPLNAPRYEREANYKTWAVCVPPIGGPFNFTRCANGTKRRPNALPFLIYTLTEGECNCVVRGWHFYDSEHYLAKNYTLRSERKAFLHSSRCGRKCYGTQQKTSITILTLIADSMRGIQMEYVCQITWNLKTKTQRRRATSTHTHKLAPLRAACNNTKSLLDCNCVRNVIIRQNSLSKESTFNSATHTHTRIHCERSGECQHTNTISVFVGHNLLF